MKLRHLIDNFAVEPYKVDFKCSMIDSESVDDNTTLIVKAHATHSLRVTGNGLLYMPQVLRDSTLSLIKPYPRPILLFHNKDKKNIGRYIDATYIPQPDPRIPQDVFNFLDSTRNYKKAISVLKEYHDLISDQMFPGLGYIDITARITDKDAIRDIINGTYLTMSIGFDLPADVINSIDGRSLYDEENEYFPKDEVDGRKVFGIPSQLLIEETSYVNTPADWYAQTYEFKLANDKVKTIQYDSTYDCRTKYDMYLDSVKDDDHKINRIYTLTTPNGGGIMKSKLTQLASDSKFCYEAMKEFLPADKVLSEDALAALEDKSFAGASKRTFPTVDAEHISAARKVLDSLEEKDKESKLFGKLQDAVNEQDMIMTPKHDPNGASPTPEGTMILGAPSETHAREEAPKGFMYDSIAEGCNTHYTDPDFEPKFTDACSKISKDAMAKVYPIVNKTAMGYGYDPINGIDPVFQGGDALKAEIETLTNEKLQLEALNSVLESQNDSLKKALEVTKSTIDSLSKNVKDSYANMVFNLKEQLGLVSEANKDEVIAELSKRSVDSLTDSMADFKAQIKGKSTGATLPILPSTDEVVPNPLVTQEPIDDSESVFEAKKKAIYDKFYSLTMEDSKAANEYLRLSIKKLKAEMEENKKK